MVLWSSTCAVTELVFLAAVTDAPTATRPTEAPSVWARCDVESLAETLTVVALTAAVPL